MALRFMDGFDHYTTLTQKWNSGGGSISAGNGRYGAGYRHANAEQLIKGLDAQATWIVGYAAKVQTLPSGSQRMGLLGLFDTGVNQVNFMLNGAGSIEVRRSGMNGTLLGSGSVVLSEGVWYYLEFKATISDTVGVAVVRVNGVIDLNLSSVDTRQAGTTANTINIGERSGTPPGFYDVDDLYICDATGGSPADDFLGDCRVEALLPDGNGTTSNLVGSDGNSTDNYLLVDEAAPNGDTDYVESSTPGDKDTYTFGNLASTSGTVYGVQVLPYAEKTDAGSRTIASIARLSATEVDSADKALASSYAYLPDIRETKPGGGAFSISDVNSTEFGVKVTA